MESTLNLNIEKIQAFCERWNVDELYLFGSAARDDFNESSDVDVLIKKSEYEGIGIYEWLDMVEELQEIFGRNVDLVSSDGVRNPFIRNQIAQTRKLIYAKEEG